MQSVNKLILFYISILVVIVTGLVVVIAVRSQNSIRPMLSPIQENFLGVNMDSPAVRLIETNINRPGTWPIFTQNPEPTAAVKNDPIPALKKNHYSVAVFGDSMEDTMGSNLDYLAVALRKKYPGISFSFYNYGIGSQNVKTGLDRLCQNFSYKDRNYQSLCDLKPDVIIIGSFAYNPFSPYNREEHWLTLAALIKEAKKIVDNVYLIAEISPNKRTFGVGPFGINWNHDLAYQHAQHIEEQLQNAVGLGKTLGIPLINIYALSKNLLTGEGRNELINASDGIHASIKGQEFTANLIASVIKLD